MDHYWKHLAGYSVSARKQLCLCVRACVSDCVCVVCVVYGVCIVCVAFVWRASCVCGVVCMHGAVCGVAWRGGRGVCVWELWMVARCA